MQREEELMPKEQGVCVSAGNNMQRATLFHRNLMDSAMTESTQ